MANIFGKVIKKGSVPGSVKDELIGASGRARREVSGDFKDAMQGGLDYDEVFGSANKASKGVASEAAEEVAPEAAEKLAKSTDDIAEAATDVASASKGKALSDLTPEEQAANFVPDKKGGWKSAVPTVAKGAGLAGLAGGAYLLGKGSDPQMPQSAGQKEVAPAAPQPEKPAAPKGPSKFYASQAKDPETVKAAYAALQLPDQADQYDEMQKQLVADLNAAQDVYANAKDSLATRELWEKVIQGVGLMAAGIYGNQTGTDVSGVKFDPTDWDKKREAARLDLRQSIDNAVKNNDISKEKLARIYDRNKDQLQINQDALKAAEQRDQFNAEQRNRAGLANQEMELKLMDLKAKALEGGDKATATQIEAFNKGQEKINSDITKFMSGVENEGMRQDIYAQVQMAEAQARQLGIPTESLRLTTSDLSRAKNPAEIGELANKRLAQFYSGSKEAVSSESTPAAKPAAYKAPASAYQIGDETYRAKIEQTLKNPNLTPGQRAQFEGILKSLPATKGTSSGW